MSSKLIDKRRKELLSLGYNPGIIEVALAWALGSAEGIAKYVQKMSHDDSLDMEEFLPQYLQDCEKYIQSFGHEPKKSPPGRG